MEYNALEYDILYLNSIHEIYQFTTDYSLPHIATNKILQTMSIWESNNDNLPIGHTISLYDMSAMDTNRQRRLSPVTKADMRGAICMYKLL